MTILLLLIPISLALLGAAVWAFIWAVRRGQFDDLDSAALDILSDDRAPATHAATSQARLGEAAGSTAGAGAGQPGRPRTADAPHDAD